MRPVTQLAVPAPAQPPPSRGAPTEASAAPFAAVLDTHQARTAVAEGHTPKRPTGADDQTTATPDARDAAADANPATATDVRKDDAKDDALPTPSAVLADPATLAAAVPVVVPALPASPTPAPAAPAAAAAPPAGLAGPDAAPAVPVPAAPLAGTALAGTPLPAAAAPAATAPPAAAPQPGTPARADAPAGIPVPVAPPAPDTPAVPTADPAPSADAAATPQGGAGQGADAGNGNANTPNDAPRPMTSPVADALRAAAPAVARATPADTSAAAAATATTPAPTTTATATAAAPAAPASSGSVPLAQAVETVRLTVSAAARSGVTRARIALRPEELGGVEVHLRHTAEGLTARVVAEVPEAAHLLAQAAGELRRSLEQQGVNIVRIDVGTAGDEAAGTGTGAAGHEQRDGRRNGGSNAAGDASETDLPIPDRTIELPNGALVDVLA